MTKLWLVAVENRRFAAELAHFHPEVAATICTAEIPTRTGSLIEVFCNSATTGLTIYNQFPHTDVLATPADLYDTDVPEVLVLSSWENVRDTLRESLSGWSYSDLNEDRDHLEELLATLPKA